MQMQIHKIVLILIVNNVLIQIMETVKFATQGII